MWARLSVRQSAVKFIFSELNSFLSAKKKKSIVTGRLVSYYVLKYTLYA